MLFALISLVCLVAVFMMTPIPLPHQLPDADAGLLPHQLAKADAVPLDPR